MYKLSDMLLLIFSEDEIKVLQQNQTELSVPFAVMLMDKV